MVYYSRVMLTNESLLEFVNILKITNDLNSFENCKFHDLQKKIKSSFVILSM